MIKEQAVDAKADVKDGAEAKKGGGKAWWIAGAVLVILLGAGAGGAFLWQSAGYLTTDNARVTTTLVSISSNTPGVLERFTAYEGRRVSEFEVLGWVERGEALRAPFDGIVVQADGVRDQPVSPMDVLAVIADTSDLHIQANIRETDIAQLYIGQPAFVTIDPFGGRQFEGFVADIGRITSAELSGQAMFFNTGGTFTRVTHLIPVKIRLTDGTEEDELHNMIGVNARVRIPIR
ncbi:MAG: HlyD family efflux transporter periplasmic adaptor subunit [Defluviitaleaceae bacterium]|nr:HlyD family efflux transporter periplasmic adaptor subunit [Defluviitaleaceae bacterium]